MRRNNSFGDADFVATHRESADIDLVPVAHPSREDQCLIIGLKQRMVIWATSYARPFLLELTREEGGQMKGLSPQRTVRMYYAIGVVKRSEEMVHGENQHCPTEVPVAAVLL